MNKQQIAKILTSDEATQLLLMAYTKKDLEWAQEVTEIANELLAEDEPTEIEAITGSVIPKKYRDTYHKAKTVSGKPTLNNGDELAHLLEAADHITTCEIADQIFDLAYGTTLAKYTTDREGQLYTTGKNKGEPMKALNNGMVRMNAGNRIRSWVAKSESPDLAISQVIAMITPAAEAA